MPLHKIHYLSNNSTIAVWYITETEEELLALAQLTTDETYRYGQLKREKRRKEWLATRALLKAAFPYQELEITYTSEGKPGLQNGWKISISHTPNFAAIIINPEIEVGIDIQVQKDNILNACHLFMSSKELENVYPEHELEQLHLYWCAKEALYKLASDSSLNIFSHIFIEPFDLLHAERLRGLVKPLGLEAFLEFEIEKGFYLVYTCS